jgi:hypothetical protein
MRLAILENGHRGVAAMAFAVIDRVLGYKPAVMQAMMYHPQFAGVRFGTLNHSALYGATSWSRAQLELFGGFVSSLNHCSF